MRVLALDTTRLAGSLALVEDDHVIGVRASDPSKSHAERLPIELLALLRDAGIALPDVDLFAVAAGPGSFTGLRIGIATMQGLAFVQRKRIVAVSALEAIAQSAAVDARHGERVAAWIDAHRGDVFSALYRVTDAPAFTRLRLAEIDPPSVGDPSRILSRWISAATPPDLFSGDGVSRFASVAQQAGRSVEVPPLAGAIGLIAIDRARGGESVDPAAVQPLYVRRPDAEIAREQREVEQSREAR